MTQESDHAAATHPAAPVRLGALETQVMDLLWENESFTVRELITQLGNQPAYTTIATVLTNLRKKGLVCTTKSGHATRYAACVSRDEHAARIMTHALDTSGDRAASMLRFVSTVGESDLELLRSFLRERGADQAT